ncbi:MAG: reverse transcriptase domain-containing protein [Nannocystaceae bacterium]
MVLEAVYEQDFLDSSYAYRPRRSAHLALTSMREGLMTMGGGWVLEVDIAGFFEELDHGHLHTFVRRRVRDGVLLRLIGKWLKAGVMEEGSVRRTSAGTPQGGVISPAPGRSPRFSDNCAICKESALAAGQGYFGPPPNSWPVSPIRVARCDRSYAVPDFVPGDSGSNCQPPDP